MVARRGITRTSKAQQGFTRIPYARTERWRTRPWLRIPKSWPGSNLEYAVYWYISVRGVEPNRRRLVMNRDYFWQRALTAPGLFYLRGFTRGDFVFPGRPGARRGIVMDPITPFTHPTFWLDLRKRSVLLMQGWRVIFLDGVPLLRNPGPLVELALRGIDLSTRGRGRT